MSQDKLLIAACSDDFLKAMEHLLSDRYSVSVCRSGKQALSLLHSHTYRLMLLDLMLPELDGLSLLEILRSEGCACAVIAVTSLINPYISDCAQRLDIGYLVRKPCDLKALASRVHDLCQPGSSPAAQVPPEERIRKILLTLGLKATHKGFSYLVDAILLYRKDPEQSFTKELYPQVGKHFGRDGKIVERSIRSSLDFAWDHRDEDLWLRYFPPGTRRPAAATFISRLSRELDDREA